MKRLLSAIAAGLVGLLVVVVPAPAFATTCPGTLALGSTSTPFNLAAGTHGNLDESSGIIASGDYTTTQTVWDQEDGGGGNFVYAHNGNNGNLRATVTLSGVSNTDWEDIAVSRTTGTDTVVVSDTGDNGYSRSNDALVAFSEPDPASGDTTIAPTVYPITFKDDPAAHSGTAHTVHPNVEAMVIDQGGASNKEVFFFAKDRDSVYGANSSGTGQGDFSVYSAGQFSSLSTTSNIASYVTSIDGVTDADWAAGKRTGPVAADISLDRNYLALKSYDGVMIWPRNGTWTNTLTTDPDAPCQSPTIGTTGSGKYEGVSFSYDIDQLFQVRDDMGGGNTPLKQQSFTP
jgi:hypothetical protein